MELFELSVDLNTQSDACMKRTITILDDGLDRDLARYAKKLNDAEIIPMKRVMIVAKRWLLHVYHGHPAHIHYSIFRNRD